MHALFRILCLTAWLAGCASAPPPAPAHAEPVSDADAEQVLVILDPSALGRVRDMLPAPVDFEHAALVHLGGHLPAEVAHVVLVDAAQPPSPWALGLGASIVDGALQLRIVHDGNDDACCSGVQLPDGCTSVPYEAWREPPGIVTLFVVPREVASRPATIVHTSTPCTRP